MKKIGLLGFVFFFALTNVGCWKTPEQGKVYVQTISGQISGVVRPPGIWTIFVFWDEYYEMTLRSNTVTENVRASSKEPANFGIQAQIAYSVIDRDDSIIAFANKYGLEASEQDSRFIPQLKAMFQTAFREEAAKYEAYTLISNQDTIQKAVEDKLRPKLSFEHHVKLEGINLLGKADFDNDDIDNAASKVVAAQKLKEAAQAELDAENINLQKRNLQAQSYEKSPALLRLEQLKLQEKIAEALAKHNGTLVLGAGSPLNLGIKE